MENTEDETETEQQAFEENKEKIALDTKENVFNDEDIKPQETVNENKSQRKKKSTSFYFETRKEQHN